MRAGLGVFVKLENSARKATVPARERKTNFLSVLTTASVICMVNANASLDGVVMFVK